MEKPLISILMNCYNGEEFLISIQLRATNQTHENWEVWDNKSNDGEKILSYSDKRLKYYYLKTIAN